MEKLDHEIVRSARKVFKLFFGSRLYLKKESDIIADDLVGVDMRMSYHGDKIFSFYMERRMLDSLKERMGAVSGEQGELDYDFMGEMANIIAGNALTGCGETTRIHPPEKANVDTESPFANRLVFSSRMGRFCISIGDAAVQ
ncbi:MAG TPA: chemotaxis protein CheX [Spirochaetota bacterium]|nr:chemotaxis protein CheX [Spirochaetota bacterium]